MCSQPFAPSFFEKTAALSFVFFQKMSNLFGSFRMAPISRGDCRFQVTRNDFFFKTFQNSRQKVFLSLSNFLETVCSVYVLFFTK
jgi:hypothetical protein